MLSSKMELLVDFGPKPDEQLLNKTLNELKSKEGVKEAIFKEGAIMVETTLPSAVVVDMVSKATGKRTVLQGFGESESAVAMVSGQSCCGGEALGVVRFHATPSGTVVEGCVDGLSGQHGLHIHEVGDLSEGCSSIGEHYNPTGSPHGRHAGDLGNVVADSYGRANFRLLAEGLKVSDIIGRSVAITESADDLGKGGSPESMVVGDGGKPIACGIIARSAGIFENPKRICACDGVVVWDEKDRPLAGKGRRAPATCCRKEMNRDSDIGKSRCCK